MHRASELLHAHTHTQSVATAYSWPRLSLQVLCLKNIGLKQLLWGKKPLRETNLVTKAVSGPGGSAWHQHLKFASEVSFKTKTHPLLQCSVEVMEVTASDHSEVTDATSPLEINCRTHYQRLPFPTIVPKARGELPDLWAGKAPALSLAALCEELSGTKHEFCWAESLSHVL